MKKRNKIFTVLTMSLLMFLLLFGCGGADKQEETEISEAEEQMVDAEDKYMPEAGDPEETLESEAQEEVDVPESGDELQTETDEVVEDPGEVEYMEWSQGVTLDGYIEAVGYEYPEIIIANMAEAYVIHLKEGQHYQLKSGDKIVFNIHSSNPYGCGWNPDLGNETIQYVSNGEYTYKELVPKYENWKEDQEFYFLKSLENGEDVRRTVYLTPPTE